MRSLIIAAIAALAFASAADAAPHCTKGKACGNSCIAMDKVCHIDSKAASTATAAATPATPAATAAKHCKNAKGKFVKCTAPGAVPA
jgi:hypothetical protein